MITFGASNMDMRIFLFISAILFSISLSGQNGTFRGHIYDDSTGDPIIYGTVLLNDGEYGTTTDLDGFFTFPSIPAGTYQVKASYIGYDSLMTEVLVKRNQVAYQKMLLKAGGVNLGVIDISGKREQARTEVKISKIQVSKKDIKLLPSTGGDSDILQYLQVLPGVVTTGDQGGQIFIRGGSPVQNKIMLDGLTIYNPFHSIGFYSIFETELIKNVDVLTGGFGAEHGGRISAIIDITTREGNQKNFGGQISASPFMLKGLIEGPLVKLDGDKGSSSFVFTTKRSIIDRTSKTLYSYATDDEEIGLPFTFNDTYGKLSFVAASGSKMSLFGFNFDDRYNDPRLADVSWKTTGGGMNFTLLPKNSSLMLNGIIGFSDYNTSLIERLEDPRTSRIREYLFGLNFTFFGNNNQIDYGIEAKSIRTEFEFVNPFKQRFEQFQNTTELSFFLKYRQVLGNLVIEPSARIQYYTALSDVSLEPRFGFKYNVSESLRLKGSAGLYSQNLISTSNERDVVNLFTGFLSGPEEQIASFEGGLADSKIQIAKHAVFGFEYDLAKGLEINVEAYIKDFGQLIIVNRNRTSISQPEYSTEEGEAYGVDFSIKYGLPKWNFWGTYSLGKVNRFDGEQTYPTVFDRRHNVNFLTTYTADSEGNLKFSLRWNLGSGFPFTLTQGFYNNQSFLEGIDTDYLTSNPENVGIIYDEDRNAGRLPYFHRLDLSANYTYHFSERMNAELVASITNAYDRPNIFYFDRIQYEREDQLPIIPSMALRLNF